MPINSSSAHRDLYLQDQTRIRRQRVAGFRTTHPGANTIENGENGHAYEGREGLAQGKRFRVVDDMV